MTSKKRRKELRLHLRIAAILQTLSFHEVGELSRIIANDGAEPMGERYDEIFTVIYELATHNYDGEFLESNVDYLLGLAEEGQS